MAGPMAEPRLIAIEKSIAGAFFAAMMLSIFLQVVTRLVSKFLVGQNAILSMPWTEELSCFAFIWLLIPHQSPLSYRADIRAGEGQTPPHGGSGGTHCS